MSAVVVGEASASPDIANALHASHAAVDAVVAIDTAFGAVLKLPARDAIHRPRRIEHDEQVRLANLTLDHDQGVHARLGGRHHRRGDHARHGKNGAKLQLYLRWPTESAAPAREGSHASGIGTSRNLINRISHGP
jgi:hypothetical protein